MILRRCTTAVLVALLLGAMGSSLWAAPVLPAPLSLTYRCNYLWLPSIGRVSLQLQPQADQQLLVTLQGQALGLAAWLDGDRHQSYQSLLQLPLDSHSNSLTHQRLTRITSGGRRIEYGWSWLFGADPLVVEAARWWGGRKVEQQTLPRRPDASSDFLALFIRFWQFGPRLQAGELYVYPLFTPDGTIQVRITVEEREAVNGFSESPRELWRCRVQCDSGELTRGCSELVLWCDDQRLPLKLQLSGVLGLGHITATLMTEE